MKSEKWMMRGNARPGRTIPLRQRGNSPPISRRAVSPRLLILPAAAGLSSSILFDPSPFTLHPSSFRLHPSVFILLIQSATGRVTVNRAPWPGSLSARMAPPNWLRKTADGLSREEDKRCPLSFLLFVLAGPFSPHKSITEGDMRRPHNRKSVFPCGRRRAQRQEATPGVSAEDLSR